MSFYDQPRAWYFHDLWKRTLSTWGTGQSWTRVDLSRPGPTLDYPDFAAAQTNSNLTILAAHGQSGIARRFRWNGSAWVLEAQRATGSDVGELSPTFEFHKVSRAELAAMAAKVDADEARKNQQLVQAGVVALGVAVLLGWV